MTIPGGYYLKPRQGYKISHSPPHVREIFDYLMGRAKYQTEIIRGKTFHRGQCFVTYDEIRESLSWYIGYRKEQYTKHQVESAMKAIMKAGVITTSRTTRGMIVTIKDYNLYQSPKNYENHNENRNDDHKENHDENHPVVEEERKREEIQEKEIPAAPSRASALPFVIVPLSFGKYFLRRNFEGDVHDAYQAFLASLPEGTEGTLDDWKMFLDEEYS